MMGGKNISEIPMRISNRIANKPPIDEILRYESINEFFSATLEILYTFKN